jgi:hypothetical protein
MPLPVRPTALPPLAGHEPRLPLAFYNEKVDHVLDGVALERPATHFFT